MPDFNGCCPKLEGCEGQIFVAAIGSSCFLSELLSNDMGTISAVQYVSSDLSRCAVAWPQTWHCGLHSSLPKSSLTKDVLNDALEELTFHECPSIWHAFTTPYAVNRVNTEPFHVIPKAWGDCFVLRTALLKKHWMLQPQKLFHHQILYLPSCLASMQSAVHLEVTLLGSVTM